MGWHCSAETKAIALRGAIKYIEDKGGRPNISTDVALIDANAWARGRHMVGSNPPCRVAKGMVDLILATGATEAGIFWDRPSVMGPWRAAVQAERAAASRSVKAPATPAEMATMTARTMGATCWESVLASSENKATAYKLVWRCLTEAIAEKAPETLVVTMTDPEGGPPWTFPADAGDTPAAVATTANLYGEADAQVVMTAATTINRAVAAGTPVPRIAIFTIDTDMALQLMGIWPRNVKVVWAKVVATDKGIHRTLTTASKAAPDMPTRPMWEMVDCNTMVLPRKQMAARMLWCLLAKGVDYCKGICKYGWTQQKLVTTMADRGSDLIELTPTGAAVDLGLLRRIMGSPGARSAGRRLETTSRPGGGAEGIAGEMDRVLFCWRYYMCFDGTRPSWGGPEEQPNGVGSPGGTVTDWVTDGPDRIELTDYHPAALPPLDPAAAHPADADALRHYLS
jgi:hypothetical protein